MKNKIKNNWRIYLNGRGYRHYRPFLEWASKLPEVKKDKKGNFFIFINNILKYKGQLVGTNLHNSEKLDIFTWLHNNVVAFDEVDKLLQLAIEKELLTEAEYKKISKDIYQLAYHKNLKNILSLVGLEDWV